MEKGYNFTYLSCILVRCGCVWRAASQRCSFLVNTVFTDVQGTRTHPWPHPLLPTQHAKRAAPARFKQRRNPGKFGSCHKRCILYLLKAWYQTPTINCIACMYVYIYICVSTQLYVCVYIYINYMPLRDKRKTCVSFL